MSKNLRTLTGKSIVAFSLAFFTTGSYSLSEDSKDNSVKKDFIKLNKDSGIIYYQRGYPSIKADLYIDKNSLNNKLPWTRLELTALLDLDNNKVGLFKASVIAKRLKIRDSPIITKEDIIKDIVKISQRYESKKDYTDKFTKDLSSLLDENLIDCYPQNYKLVVDSSEKSISISSYDDKGNLVKSSTLFNEEKIDAYNSWISQRMNEDFDEIQDENREGRENHLSYLKEKLSDSLTVNK